jgi:hypothetical protein
MDKFDVAVGFAVLIFISLVLSGLWSIFDPARPFCNTLLGFVILGVLAGGSLLLARWYKSLETVGAALTVLYLVVMWIVFASPGTLQYC